MAKLYMLLIGCLPKGRHTEQHDVYFDIGENIREILPRVAVFWPEAGKTLHLDAWREVTHVNGYDIVITDQQPSTSNVQLFFINLGGYKQGEFEEFHYKMIVAADDKSEAIRISKQTAFYRHTGFKGANSHIDDKYGVDVDDIYALPEILPHETKSKYSIHSVLATGKEEDELHLGYFRLDKVDKWAPKII